MGSPSRIRGMFGMFLLARLRRRRRGRRSRSVVLGPSTRRKEMMLVCMHVYMYICMFSCSRVGHGWVSMMEIVSRDQREEKNETYSFLSILVDSLALVRFLFGNCLTCWSRARYALSLLLLFLHLQRSQSQPQHPLTICFGIKCAVYTLVLQYRRPD